MKGLCQAVLAARGTVAAGLGVSLVWAVAQQGRAATGVGLDRSHAVELYTEAKQLFRQANEVAVANPEKARDLYRQAVMRFERLVHEGGIRNGKLYYNIGNGYFRMNDIGRAILNYRRAARFIPTDSNLRQNLEYARSRRLDKIEERRSSQVLKTLLFWHYDLAQGLRAVLFVVAHLTAWLSASIGLFVRRRLAARVWAIACSVSLVFGVSVAADEAQQARRRPGVVVAEEVVARKGDGEVYEPSFKEPLHSGTEFTLVERRGGWCNIRLADSRTCWVPEKSVEQVFER